MTLFTPAPSPAPAPPTRPQRFRGLVVIGAVLLTIGALAGAAATAAMIAFRSGSTLDSGSQLVSTPTSALVSDVTSLQDVDAISGLTGRPTLRISAAGTGPTGVFVGVGPADAVSGYLSGVAVDRVTDLGIDPFDLQVTREDGAAVPPPPGEQDFWVASATSSSAAADLTWQFQDGDYRFVVMNADGTPGVTSSARMQLTLPNALPISVAVLIGSGVVALAGTVLLVAAVRRGRIA